MQYAVDSLDLDSWLAQLPTDCLVVTPNQRLARFYTEADTQRQQRLGLSVFHPLQTVAQEAWLKKLWQQWQLLAPAAQEPQTILPPLVKRALWQQVLKNDEALLDSGELIEPALEAYQWCSRWGFQAADIPAITDEAERFTAWLSEYHNLLAAEQSLDDEGAQDRLLSAIACGELAGLLPKTIIFSGFDQQQAPLKRLEQALCDAGCEVAHHRVRCRSEKLVRLSPDSATTELELAASWAKRCADRGETVALIVPDLGARLAEIERVFARFFEPENLLVGAQPTHEHFNISSGKSLASCAMIKAALNLLAWRGAAMSVLELKALLASAFLLKGDESRRLQLLLSRLSEQTTQLTLTQLRAEVATQNAASDAADLPQPLSVTYQALESLAQGIKQLPSRAKISDWVTYFLAQLEAVGWPGERTLNSWEYQQKEHWQQVLDHLSSLDRWLADITFNEALSLLREALKAPFHAQTPPAKVQVLGLLEAAGQLFDNAWWLGVNSHRWPEPVAPNPLLPASWQRENAMPRASASHELAYAQHMTERLRTAAKNIVISAPAFDGDEPLSPSPLIADIPVPDDITPWQCVRHDDESVAMLEVFTDDTAPKLATPIEVAGGASLLKRQSACPFQAFALHRLQAFTPEPLEAGISALDRGNLMHEVLEAVWLQLKTHEQLLALADCDLEQLIASCAKQAVQRLQAKRQLGDKLCVLEINRLIQRVGSWLLEEKQREPFSVLDQEKTLKINLAGLQLQLRIDRVDCLSDGKTLAVIDYKTGQTTLSSWQLPQLDEPQVPLYATALPNVGAAVFAQVNTQTMRYLGLADMPSLFGDITSVSDHRDWPENFSSLLASWQADLQATARAFVNGQTAVNPKKASVCQWCNLQALCRVGETLEDELTAPKQEAEV